MLRCSPPHLSCAFAFLVVLGGCGSGDINFVPGPGNPPPPPEGPATQITAIREDFDNRHQVAEIDRAQLDVNAGVLSLEVDPLPELDGTGETVIDQNLETNGRIEAKNISILAGVTVNALDGLELRASGAVEVHGLIRAGLGGVTIAAAHRIVLAGRIESRGPVRIQTTQTHAEVRVSGGILARNTANDDGEPSAIAFRGRGSVWLAGRIETSAEAGQTAGDISVRVYGSTTVTGTTAVVHATSEVGGIPGSVRFWSESSLRLINGARVGYPAAVHDTIERPLAVRLSGNIELEAPKVEVGEGARVIGGRKEDRGADVRLVASGGLHVGPSAVVRSGVGSASGGALSLMGREVTVKRQTQLAAGEGLNGAGLLEVSAAERLDFHQAVSVTGGSAACADGGDIRILVAGPLTAHPDVSMQAGSGGQRFASVGCAPNGAGGAGGSIIVHAHAIDGLDTSRLIRGAGTPAGTVELRISDEVRVDLPDLALQTHGSVVSIVLERAAALDGQSPDVAEVAEVVPPNTRVLVELAGSTEPHADFSNFVNARMAGPLATLADARYFRFRVRLWGRIYDAPVVDYLEIRLR